MDATRAIQDSIHVFSLVRKYVSRILGTYHPLVYPKIHSFLIIIGQKGMKNNLKMVRNRAKQKLVVQFFF